ncbi:MAG: Holliday junction branch migration protein RuvA [Nitrospirota bacterium]
MIASISGILTYKSPDYIIIENNGIGFQIFTSLTSFYNLPSLNERIMLHTHLYLRTDIIQLYGFLTPIEKEIFLLLITISGIGPRLALSILSGMSIDDFINTVREEDIKKLNSIPGVGKKTAGRLILELKEKISRLSDDQNRGKVNRNKREVDIIEDVLSALTNLGYNKNLAKEAAETVCNNKVKEGNIAIEELAIEELIKESLKVLSR